MATFDRVTCSWKTCRPSLLMDSDTFSGRWPKAGSLRSGTVFARPTSAHRTDESGGSYWHTPRTQEDGSSPEALAARKERARLKHAAGMYGKGCGAPSMGSLQTQAIQFWPTPAARDIKGTNQESFEARGGGRKGEQLPNFVRHHWPTPNAHDGRQQAPDLKSTQGGNLSRDAAMWPTPTRQDCASSGSAAYSTESGRHSGTTLTDASRPFRPDHPTSTPGEPFSSSGPTSRPRLNPLFTEWLMGLPQHWTDIEMTDSTRAATAYSRWWRRMRGALCRLGWSEGGA